MPSSSGRFFFFLSVPFEDIGLQPDSAFAGFPLVFHPVMVFSNSEVDVSQRRCVPRSGFSLLENVSLRYVSPFPKILCSIFQI